MLTVMLSNGGTHTHTMMTTLELSQPPPLFLHPTVISAQSYMYTTTYSQYQQRLYLLVVCGIFS